jgi:hypothetical protein
MARLETLHSILNLVFSGAWAAAHAIFDAARTTELDLWLPLKLAAIAAALVSVGSNWSIFFGIHKTLISCERVFDFRGLGIGPSDDFVDPLRSLLFGYAIYLFYQLVSQAYGLGETSLTSFWIDFGLQAFLFLIVLCLLIRLWLIARTKFKVAGVQMQRFTKEFGEILEQRNLSLRNLIGSTFILPVASIVPRAFEHWKALAPLL